MLPVAFLLVRYFLWQGPFLTFTFTFGDLGNAAIFLLKDVKPAKIIPSPGVEIDVTSLTEFLFLVKKSCIESSAIEKSCIESSAIEKSCIESSAIENSCIESSTIEKSVEKSTKTYVEKSQNKRRKIQVPEKYEIPIMKEILDEMDQVFATTSEKNENCVEVMIETREREKSAENLSRNPVMTKDRNVNEKYSCQICHIFYNSKNGLEKHMRTEHTKKPFYCDNCNYVTYTKYCIITHQKTYLKKKLTSFIKPLKMTNLHCKICYKKH